MRISPAVGHYFVFDPRVIAWSGDYRVVDLRCCGDLGFIRLQYDYPGWIVFFGSKLEEERCSVKVGREFQWEPAPELDSSDLQLMRERVARAFEQETDPLTAELLARSWQQTLLSILGELDACFNAKREAAAESLRSFTNRSFAPDHDLEIEG